MQAASPATPRLKRDAFAPPPERGLGPATTLAILVHLALLLCLSWVVKWHDQPVILTAQAELWAKLPPPSEPERPAPPEPALPVRPPEPPAPPPPPAALEKAKPEPVKAVPKPEPEPSPKVINPRQAEADIAAQKKKAQKLADEKAAKLALEAEAEAARKKREKEEAELARKQREKDEAETARKQKEKDELEAARKQKEEKEAAIARAEQEKKQAEAEAARKAREKELAARKEAERQRKELEDRIKKMAKESEIKEQTDDLKKRIVQKADVDSSTSDTSNAANKLVAKPSDKYIASIQAAIRPNITFDADTVSGNPAVEIQVGLTPEGAIVSISTIKSSGIESWDTAATRALKKTDRLPKDENGRVPPTLSIVLRPRER